MRDLSSVEAAPIRNIGAMERRLKGLFFCMVNEIFKTGEYMIEKENFKLKTHKKILINNVSSILKPLILSVFMVVFGKHLVGNSEFGYSLRLCLPNRSHKSLLVSALSKSNSC